MIYDANVYVSYLLRPNEARTCVKLVNLALSGGLTLLVLDELIQELVRNVRGKPWLVHRINEQLLDELVESLYAGGVMLPAHGGLLPRVVIDPDDDYLMAAAIASDADYLVTGDKHLLALRSDFVEKPAILTPAEFLQVLENRYA